MCGSCPGGGLIFISATLGVGLLLPAALDWQNSESLLAEANDAVTLSRLEAECLLFCLGQAGGSRWV